MTNMDDKNWRTDVPDDMFGDCSSLTYVVGVLHNMFSQTVNEDVIVSVVNSCNGDLTQSLEALMKITEAKSVAPNTAIIPDSTTENIPEAATSSYAHTPKSTGALPKVSIKTKHNPGPILNNIGESNVWDEQLVRIVRIHNDGYRVLIILRGLPGSGKSYLAKKIVEITVGGGDLQYRTHICSTDDFFYHNGNYMYNVSKLSEAHSWNQQRVRSALQRGLSPVIVDNTNVEMWEMKPYFEAGLANGYYIEIIEPRTDWAKHAGQLAKRNTHGVPLPKIRKMLEAYQNNLTVDYVIRRFNYGYPKHWEPPVYRCIPAFVKNEPAIKNQPKLSISMLPDKNQPFKMGTDSLQNTFIQPTSSERLTKTPVNTPRNDTSEITNGLVGLSCETGEREVKIPALNTIDSKSTEEQQKLKNITEGQKKMDEYEKVSKEWDMSGPWVETSSMPNNKQIHSPPNASTMLKPKPPRNHNKPQSDLSENMLFANGYEWNGTADWQSISSTVPAWDHDVQPKSKKGIDIGPETRSISTCIEIRDTDISKNCDMRILSTSSRDINFSYMPSLKEKIPNKRMLHKSSMTYDEDTVTDTTYRCENEAKHFIAFRKMFKNIASSQLKDIFDNCCGDVNWAVEIVLDGVEENSFDTNHEEELSDDEIEQDTEICSCLAAYSIVPSGGSKLYVNKLEPATGISSVAESNQRKVKKDKIVSESSMQLKRQIEGNVVIADTHYSNYNLKIRNIKRGDPPSHSPVPEAENVAGALEEAADVSDDEASTSAEEAEETINFTLGPNFISQLGNIFGNPEVKYPEHIVPLVSMPKSLLIQIHAVWMESLTHQIEMQTQYSQLLLQQDEQLARNLAQKEQELENAGLEPEVPDFKEIMDMDLAQTLYDRDVAEWKNNEPNDLAAKMTREKLFNLFPDVAQDILAEILLAYDNSFQSTVEVLLTSMGHTSVLAEKNGINKFVMEREMARQERALQDVREKELSQEEWPVLGQVKADMTMVDQHREEAKKHLQKRDLNYNKAQEYYQRGMTQVATHYSDMAVFHKQKFEHANSMAASTLIQVHSANKSNTTLDLHYLYVAEALQTLDMFLDHHIQKLIANPVGSGHNSLFLITGRGLHSRGGPKVKPAVKKRLKGRGFFVQELNPGLLTVMISTEHKLTHQLPKP